MTNLLRQNGSDDVNVAVEQMRQLGLRVAGLLYLAVQLRHPMRERLESGQDLGVSAES